MIVIDQDQRLFDECQNFFHLAIAGLQHVVVDSIDDGGIGTVGRGRHNNFFAPAPACQAEREGLGADDQ